MAAEHTPGPWRVEARGDEFDGWAIRAGDHVGAIARTGASDWDNGIEEANARLIAAAPDLLAALREARDWVKHRRFSDHEHEIVAQIDAAISAATGGREDGE